MNILTALNNKLLVGDIFSPSQSIWLCQLWHSAKMECYGLLGKANNLIKSYKVIMTFCCVRWNLWDFGKS
jgi:hypothetical protein